MQPGLVDQLEDENVKEDLDRVPQLSDEDIAQLREQGREDQVEEDFNHAHGPRVRLPLLGLDDARRLVVLPLVAELVRAEQRLGVVVRQEARVCARRDGGLGQQRRDVEDGRRRGLRLLLRVRGWFLLEEGFGGGQFRFECQSR